MYKLKFFIIFQTIFLVIKKDLGDFKIYDFNIDNFLIKSSSMKDESEEKVKMSTGLNGHLTITDSKLTSEGLIFAYQQLPDHKINQNCPYWINNIKALTTPENIYSKQLTEIFGFD